MGVKNTVKSFMEPKKSAPARPGAASGAILAAAATKATPPAPSPAPLPARARGKDDPELGAFILASMARGLTVGAVAALVGVSKRTLHRWAAEDEALGEAVERGKAAFLLFWELELQASARGLRGRDGVRACEFALRAADAEWNPAQRLDHSGEIEGAGKQQLVVMISPEDADL